MTVLTNHLTTKAIVKVKVPQNENKVSSSTYLVNPNVSDQVILEGMNTINSLMDLPAFMVLKVVTSELIGQESEE